MGNLAQCDLPGADPVWSDRAVQTVYRRAHMAARRRKKYDVC